MPSEPVLNWLAPREVVSGTFTDASLSIATGSKRLAVGMKGMVQAGKYQFVSTPRMLLSNYRLLLVDRTGGVQTQAIFHPQFLKHYVALVREQNQPTTIMPQLQPRLARLFLPPGTPDELKGGWGGCNFFYVIQGVKRSEGLLGPKQELEFQAAAFRSPDAIERLGKAGGFLARSTAKALLAGQGLAGSQPLFLRIHEGDRLVEIQSAVERGLEPFASYMTDSAAMLSDYNAAPSTAF